jgi:hypothetical protein
MDAAEAATTSAGQAARNKGVTHVPPTLESASHDLNHGTEERFEHWIGKPEIKLILSILPPMQTDQQKDCLRMLLECAFRDGWDSGQCAMAGVMLRDRRDRKHEPL